MQLTFSTDDIKDTMVYVEGEATYRFDTLQDGSVTLMTRLTRRFEVSKVVAKLHWATADRVKAVQLSDNELLAVDEFIPRTSQFGRSRLLRCPNGDILKWKVGDAQSLKLECVNSTNQPIAKHRFASGSSDSWFDTLEIANDQDQEVIDLVVLSCVIVKIVDSALLSVAV